MPQHTDDHAVLYDRIAPYYDVISDASEGPARRAGEMMLDVRPGESVLEIGYGTGHCIEELACQVGDSGFVTGVDVSEEMLVVAETRLDRRKDLRGRYQLLREDARHLSFADDEFDAVFASFTLELFDDANRRRVLQEVWRVLRPGGRFAVVSMTVPADPKHPGLLESAYVWAHRHFPRVVDCHPIDVEGSLRDCGFEVVRTNRTSVYTLPVAMVVGVKRSP